MREECERSVQSAHAVLYLFDVLNYTSSAFVVGRRGTARRFHVHSVFTPYMYVDTGAGELLHEQSTLTTRNAVLSGFRLRLTRCVCLT